MFDANTPALREQYPNGATVYDRTGREIANAIAYNPETGEVITHSVGWITRAWFNALWVQDPFSYAYLRRFDWLRIGPRLLKETVVDGELLSRHGFWPAPLRVERKQIAPPPGWDSWASLADHARLKCALRVKAAVNR